MEFIDKEGKMAKKQLKKTKEYAEALCDYIQDDTQLPAWIQSKITKIADYIGTVKHYLMDDSDEIDVHGYEDSKMLLNYLKNKSLTESNIEEAEYKGKDITLNKPFRTSGGPKKFAVYVKNPKTNNVIKVNFGDKNMEIKRDDPDRRKAFRSRHNCDDKKDKTKAGYWSCKFWSSKSVSDLLKK